MRKSQVGLKRDVLPDPIYNSKVAMKTINALMQDGKKGKAQTIFYKSMDELDKKIPEGEEPFDVFMKALDNIKPEVEVKSRRVGGANYQVPVETTNARAEALGIRWLVQYARKRRGKSMSEKLADEIYDAYNKTGGAYKKKEDTYRMAEANKAFAHLNW